MQAGRALSRRLRAATAALFPRLPACPAHPPPHKLAPPPRPARRRSPEPGTHLARELCVLVRLLFPASPQPAAPSRRPARWAVRGSPKARGEDTHHMAARSQPPECAGKGEGKDRGEAVERARARRQRERAGGRRGRRRALTVARLRSQPRRARSLLRLLRRRRLGAVCSAQHSSRSPRNAHTLNRYIVDIRR